jgi:hypothetical protein
MTDNPATPKQPAMKSRALLVALTLEIIALCILLIAIEIVRRL